MIKHNFVRIATIAACALAVAAPAMAVPLLDLSTAATAITAELTPAVAAALPIAGTLLAAMLGWKFFKRFVN